MQEKIDTSAHPSGWYIFEPRFLVKTIHLARQVIDKNMPAEVPTTTDGEMDRLLQMQPANFWLNVAQMAELCHSGYPVDLVVYEDSLKVYTYVQNHLECAMKALVNSINTVEAPLDDLMILDEFAGRVFAHARYLMGKTDLTPVSMISGLNITGLGENSIFKAVGNKSLDPAKVKAEATPEDDGYPVRSSFAGQIAQLQANSYSTGGWAL